ncbi:hypothetical protein FPQ18DRAFT_410039 [Pyronema domesticum]|nr:hypothetical protein FPQ18DRAFT_410039 [Pyronema domesticum]
MAVQYDLFPYYSQIQQSFESSKLPHSISTHIQLHTGRISILCSRPLWTRYIGSTSSSVITLTLYAYISIHLNIAPNSDIFTIVIINFGVKRALVYKFKWVFIALLAPEFVLFSALDQWYNARALCRELKRIGTDDINQQTEEPQYDNNGKSQFPSNEESQSDNDESLFIKEDLHKNSNGDYDAEEIYTNAGIENLLLPTIVIPTGSETKDWTDITMTSAFFIIMGGFAYRRGQSFEIPDSELKFPNLILTPAGFLQLASKSDSLAKLLVCAQAFWMVINVIARKANRLPNTLIELNVVVHVVITIFVHALWWNKPLAVQNPVILNPVAKSDEELDYRIP